MNSVSKNKVLLTIIAVLLIANIILLAFFFRMDSGSEEVKRPGFSERLKTEVGFTPEQISVYDPKKKNFWDGMRQRFDSLKGIKERFYFQMYDASIPDSTIASRADSIGMQQKDLDLHVIRHFKDIRSMCTPEQLPKFDSLLPSIIDRMTRPSKR